MDVEWVKDGITQGFFHFAGTAYVFIGPMREPVMKIKSMNRRQRSYTRYSLSEYPII